MKSVVILAILVLPLHVNAQDMKKPGKKKPSRPSIVWSNPPSAKHLPLTRGASHRTFRSERVAEDVGYVVYLPPEYETDPERRFPVIYNLHGNGGNELTSLNVVKELHAQILSKNVPPLIMVLANGGHSTFYKDSFDGRFPIESIFIHELIPHIDSSYRTIANGTGRCIEGFSMGGRGSTRLAMKFPQMFCSLFCQAGNVPHLLETYDELDDAARAAHLLGPDRAKWESDDVYAVTEKNKQTIKRHIRIQIACGTKDGGHLKTVRDYHRHLTELGIDHTYTELQGLAHKRTEMMAQLRPLWFDGHVRALQRAATITKRE